MINAIFQFKTSLFEFFCDSIWVIRRTVELANQRRFSIFGFVYKEERYYFWSFVKKVKRIKVSNKRHAHQITKVVCVCTTRVQSKYSICNWDASKLSFMSRTKTANRLHASYWLQRISFSDEFKYSLIHKVEMVRYCVVLLFAVFVHVC